MTNNDQQSNDNDVLELMSNESQLDDEEQRQLDIDNIHDLVASNDDTRHLESITGDGGAMMISPDGIVVTLEPDGMKSVKFTNLNHESIPQWYIEEHNETVLKRIASLEKTLSHVENKLADEKIPDPEKEVRIVKTIQRLQRKAQHSDASEKEIKRLEKIIDDLSHGSLLSARGCNEALMSKYNNKIDHIKSMLESARKTLK